MLNGLFRTYKKIIILILILLCAAFFWFYGCHRQSHGGESTQVWEEKELSESGGTGWHFETESLSGDVVFGTRGYLARDRTLPVCMELSCAGDAFTGTLKITLPGTDGEGVSYQSAVSCRQGEPAQVVMEVPSLGNVAYFYFEILDSFGSVQFSQRVDVRDSESASAGKDLYIGVLSSQYMALDYLEGLEMETGDECFVLHPVRFLEADVPTDVRELGSLSGILIDSFDTSRLSQEQKDCLSSWVSGGGSLFVGTGTGAEVVLPGIKSMLKLRAGDVREVQYDFINALSEAGSARLYAAELPPLEQGQWESLSFSAPSSVYRKGYGDGKITVLTFSLTDDTFLQWTGRDDVVRQLFREETGKTAERDRADDTSLWYAKTALYAFMNGRRPDTFYYGLFFIVYLGVLGFFAYYLLRKIKRREYIWGVVPVVAVLFTVSLAFRSDGGDGTKEAFSALRVNDAAVGQDDYYLLFQNNEGKEDRVDLISSIERVEPVDYVYRTEGGEEYSVRNITENYTINNTRNGFDIAFEESIPGISYILKCSGGAAQTDTADCFTTEMTAAHSYFEGTVTNRSRWTFAKVMLIRGRQYTVLGDMEPGETRTVDADEVRFWSEYQNGQDADGEEGSAVGSLMEYLKQRYMLVNDDSGTLLVIGVTDENDFALLANGDRVGNHLTAFVNRFALPDGEDAECIIDINDCLDDKEHTSPLRYGMLEKRETKASYTFDSTRVVWGLFRNRDGFRGAIYAYNYYTGEMDRILEEEDDVMNCQELEPYVSDMNEVTLSYTLPADSDYGEAPAISVLMKETGQ